MQEVITYMSCRAKSRHLLLALLLLALASCTKPQAGEQEMGDAIWHLTTKAGPHVDKVATFRASLLDNGNGVLRSDGSYSGYYTADGWLYPCRTNALGDALDTDGNIVPWSLAPADWFAATDTNSQYALRGATKRVYDYADTYYERQYVSEYSMVLTSPAVRMSSFRPSGSPALTPLHATNPDDWRWGFAIDRRTSTWAISEVDPMMNLNATFLKNPETGYMYTYACDSTLYEHRSLLTVKIACGALTHANINKVYFTNIISEAYFMPMWRLMPLQYDPYEEWKKDGCPTVGDYDPSSYDPLASYYTTNTYPASAGETTGAGDVFAVPPGEDDVHLVRHPALTEDFIANNEWTQLTDPADEWVKGDDTKCVLTPIRDFPILPLDYSVMDGDQYKYNDIMPKVVILSGVGGNIKTTVRIAVNLEPMKKYTMWLFVSNVYVIAVFTVSDWTIHTHWSDDPSDPNYNKETADLTLGSYKLLATPVLTKSEWTTVTVPDAQGTIDNPEP